jgi:CRP-like cAMP-binding protein
MALVDEEPRSASAVAAEEATLVVFTRESLVRLSDKVPALAFKLMQNIAKLISRRLRRTSGALVDMLEN